MREAAYEHPWSHAVLRALEIEMAASGTSHQEIKLAERLGIAPELVRDSLKVLLAAGQVRKTRGHYRPHRVFAVDASQEPVRARRVRKAWTRIALERLEQDAPGSYGYSVFAVSKADLRRIRELHLEYVRAIQQVISQSQPNECVALYCAQLVDLGQNDNALERQ